jgi:hypothetical protein
LGKLNMDEGDAGIGRLLDQAAGRRILARARLVPQPHQVYLSGRVFGSGRGDHAMHEVEPRHPG